MESPNWLTNYQLQVERGMRVGVRVNYLSHAALGLCGEAGEVADIIKKSQYEGRDFDGTAVVRVREELGDALWYLTYLASYVGCTLEEIIRLNHAKLRDRYPERYTRLAE